MKFTPQAAQQLRALVDQAVATPDTIPGVTVVAVGKDGAEPFVYSAGKRGLASNQDMTPDHVFWIASFTKIVTAIACMQLVEQGVLSLDDTSQAETLCPELRSLKVLKDNGQLEPKHRAITLRMLLSHTAGFGYSFNNNSLREWGYPDGLDELSGDLADMHQPLLFQPGESWAYGIGADWAGIMIERATKLRLNDYFHEHIFKPMGLANINMFPTPHMKHRLALMHQRAPDGKLAPRDHPYRRPIVAQTRQEQASMHHSGGGGLFAKPQDFSRILAVLLNNGTCPTSGAKLVEPATVDQIFTNQIPHLPQFGRLGIAASKPEFTNALPDLYPTPGNSPQGWGLSLMLSGGTTGRSPATGVWGGLPNLFYWVDRENAVGGMVCCQILPHGDANVAKLFLDFETAVYQALNQT
ncbi:hypothetical protein CDD82_7057 [Ophiocordyceps australis]|uniref:Beta-lactamase-related domain-containing protein n=1 Tax=Ophiocordyceps australis TaxID=1399860 RepID=A0A2C5YSC2_9HYPO|nr:hypothetical protein CDD82_7057 [Ophiocordyceps australis]